MEADQALLQRFIDAGDADAFASLVRRHTAMVFHTCVRVLSDRHAAEDAAQETFHRLMLRPETVTFSLPAWLHRVATRIAIDRLRHDSARRRREAAYQHRREQDHSQSWADVSALVDEALASLGDLERALLVEHFLLGRTQHELARDQRVSRATMCRRINAALEKLRASVRPGPVAVGAAAVLTSLQSASGQTLPLTLQLELGKMAMLSGATAGGSFSGAGAGVGVGGGAAVAGGTGGFLGMYWQSWCWLAGMVGGAALTGIFVVAVILLASSTPQAGPSLDRVGERAAAAMLSEESSHPHVTDGQTIYVAPADDRMSPGHVVAFRVDGGQVALVFADTHVKSMSIEQARPLIEQQAGATLEQLIVRHQTTGGVSGGISGGVSREYSGGRP